MPIEIDEPSLEGRNKDDFTISSHTCANQIVKQCTIDLAFKPHAADRTYAVVVISPKNSKSSFQRRRIEISGTGVGDNSADGNPAGNPSGGAIPFAPHMVVATNDPLCFAGHKVVKNGDVKIREERIITVTNTGNGPLIINQVLPSNDDFVVKPESCSVQGSPINAKLSSASLQEVREPARAS